MKKKLLIILLAGLMTLSFTACGEGSISSQEQPQETAVNMNQEAEGDEDIQSQVVEDDDSQVLSDKEKESIKDTLLSLWQSQSMYSLEDFEKFPADEQYFVPATDNYYANYSYMQSLYYESKKGVISYNEEGDCVQILEATKYRDKEQFLENTQYIEKEKIVSDPADFIPGTYYILEADNIVYRSLSEDYFERYKKTAQTVQEIYYHLMSITNFDQSTNTAAYKEKEKVEAGAEWGADFWSKITQKEFSEISILLENDLAKYEQSE